MAGDRRRPRWVPWLAAAVAVIAFCGLGGWQIQRAREKAARLEAIESGGRAPPTELPAGRQRLEALAYRAVRLDGRLLGNRQFLLDNRTLEGRAGFDVLTPLVLADGRTVLVDRGWVPASPQREPARPVALGSSTRATVTGRVWLPEAGLALGPALTATGDDGWPRLATRVDFAALEAALGRELVPAVIRARGRAPWLLQPRPLEPGFGPMRHYGYAFQWFALALAVVVVTYVVGRRRPSGHGHDRP